MNTLFQSQIYTLTILHTDPACDPISTNTSGKLFIEERHCFILEDNMLSCGGPKF